jgi:hypothetical protein
LTQQLLDWLVPGGSVATPVVRVGEAAAVVPLPEATSVDVTTPDGNRVRVAPPFPAPPFGNTLQPGVYEVVQTDAAGRQTTSQFAANFVSPEESRLSVDLPGTTVLSTGPGAVTRAGSPAAPRELWQWAAAVGVVLLAVEWWASHRQ